MFRSTIILGILNLFVLMGCGKTPPEPSQNDSDGNAAKSPTSTGQQTNPKTKSPAPSPVAKKTPEFKPLTLGALGGSNSTRGGSSKAKSAEETLDNVLDAMQPLQVFLGQWNTTTRTMGAGSAKWVWDFKTDKSQPALVMSTKDHPYFETVRLTFLTDKQKYQLTAQDKDKQQRMYLGKFTEELHYITGDSGKPEPRFEMMLDEVGNEDARKLVGVKLTQRDRNRMWMEVYRRVGKSSQKQDNVTSQRAGTSFAVSDTDYGDKECIVSQGLGTTTVSYMGRTFYVCCSGCQAAFNDDPTFWINKAEERKKSEKK